VLYLRCSKQEQAEGPDNSIDQQRSWATDACRREGIELLAEFVDEAKRGHDTSKRADLHAMLAFCREQKRKREPVDVLVCWHPNRFSRADSLETSWFVHEFRSAGAGRMFTSQGWIDFSKMTDRLLYQIQQDASSHKYSSDLAGTTTRGKVAAAKRGQWCGGPPPYGYRVQYCVTEHNGKPKVVPDKLVIDPDAGPVVTGMFAEYAAGKVGLHAIAARLNAAGIAPPLAKVARKGRRPGPPLWSAPTVRKVLTNPRYLGDMVWNETTQGKFCCVIDGMTKDKEGAGQRRCQKNDPKDHVIVTGKHDPLTDVETFHRCQELLARHARGRTGRGRGDFALTGLLRCGHCGAPMVGRTAFSRNRKGPRVATGRRYVCAGYWNFGKRKCRFNPIDEKPLLAAIGAKLRDKLLSPDVRRDLEKAVEEVLAEDDTHNPDKSADLERQLAQAQQDVDRAADRLLLEVDPGILAACRGRLPGLVKRRDDLMGQLQAARSSAADRDAVKGNVASAIDAAQRLCELLPKGDPKDVRPALRALVDRVELWWRHEPNPSRPDETLCTFVKGVLYPREDLLPVPVLTKAFT
jgi:DNA invertase Pin-like site-specific DNA recombinase